jgi:putative methyltransferase (TIGR04325 family)
MHTALYNDGSIAIRDLRRESTQFSYRGLKRTVERVPVLRQALEILYERQFAGDAFGACRGVFGDFAAAARSAPKTKPVGFDREACARQFGRYRDKVFSFDYPMLFRLSRLLPSERRIFDYGGSVGTQFYAYSAYLQYPDGLSWRVCELPEITRAGEELARKSGRSGLTFTTRFEDARYADILIAAGSLQYVESPALAEALSGLRRMPRHLLLNKLPLYDGERFVTLQNGGAAFHPHYVFNRRDFIGSLTALGYRLEDRWDVDSRSGYIPFNRERSFSSYTGLYLTLTQASGSCA